MPNLYAALLEKPPLRTFFIGEKQPYFIVVFVSSLLFSLSIYNDDILNDDGIDYIYAAYEYSIGNFEKAQSYRPETLFFSQLAILSKLTGLPLKSTAFILSALTQLIMGCGLIAITRSLGAPKTTQLMAILAFASISSLNELRPHILRGFGYWACQLWAIWAFIIFIQTKKIRFILLWLSLVLISIIYRHEGILYLVLIPFFAILIFNFSLKTRLIYFLSIIFITTIFIGGYAYTIEGNLLTKSEPSTFFKLNEELKRLVSIKTSFDAQKEKLKEIMPNKWARATANDLLIGGLLFHLLKTLILATNIVVFSLAAYKISISKNWWDTPIKRLLNLYFGIGILIGLLSVFTRYFIGERYVMISAILCCIPASLMLADIFDSLKKHQLNSTKKIIYSAIFIVLAASIAHPLFSTEKKKLYFREAGSWIKKNIGSNANTYINEQKIAFYTDSYHNDSFKQPLPSMQDIKDKTFEYLILHANPNTPKNTEERDILVNLNEFKTKEFSGNGGNKIYIYTLP